MNTKLIVSDFMTINVVVAGLHNKVSEITRFYLSHKIQHLPITENEKIIGMVSMVDLMNLIHEELLIGSHLDLEAIDRKYPISSFMTALPTCIAPETTIGDALKVMCDAEIQALPVLENNRVVGIVTNKDLVKMFCLELNPPHANYSIENPGFGI